MIHFNKIFITIGLIFISSSVAFAAETQIARLRTTAQKACVAKGDCYLISKGKVYHQSILVPESKDVQSIVVINGQLYAIQADGRFSGLNDRHWVLLSEDVVKIYITDDQIFAVKNDENLYAFTLGTYVGYKIYSIDENEFVAADEDIFKKTDASHVVRLDLVNDKIVVVYKEHSTKPIESVHSAASAN